MTSVFLWLVVAATAAQPPQLPLDLARAVESGMTEVLAARFGPQPTPDEHHLLAQAYANRARAAEGEDERARACDEAARHYEAWIAAVAPTAPPSADSAAALEAAAARAEYAGFLLSTHAAADLDQLELTGGRRGDRTRAVRLLSAALAQYNRAAAGLEPQLRNLAQREDELLAAGLYDWLVQLQFDLEFNTAWTRYYLASLAPPADSQRAEHLRAAGGTFQRLIASNRAGSAAPRCRLGLGMCERELGNLASAERELKAVLTTADGSLAAQVRYELARTQLTGRRFEETRALLAPLLEQDPAGLAADEQPERFYISLAQLWEANSFLLEAATLRRQAPAGSAGTGMLAQSRRARETGLLKLQRLADRGGPWPALAYEYIGAALDPQTDPAELTPLELLLAARQLAALEQHRAALVRIAAALARPDLNKRPEQQTTLERDCLAQLIFERGRCLYHLGELAGAAEAFQRIMREQPAHPLAAHAATFAWQMRTELAQRSNAPADYARLADTLLELLQTFSDHPDRAEAVWLLPVALQAAGRYAEAALEFAKVPPASPHGQEAGLRVLLCQQLALEAERARLDPPAYAARVRDLAGRLVEYARQVERNAAAQPASSNALGPEKPDFPPEPPAAAAALLAGEARVTAAQMLTEPAVDDAAGALTALADFEDSCEEADLLGRALAARLRAYRSQRDFARAAPALADYLRRVPPERAGPILAALVHSVQEEIERLRGAGAHDDARALARQFLPAFAQFESWLRGQPERAALSAGVLARAQLLYLAGELSAAEALLKELLTAEPQNGRARFLLAQSLTARVLPDAWRLSGGHTSATTQSTRNSSVSSPPVSPEPATPAAPPDAAARDQLEAAQAAWAVILADGELRTRAPHSYWEARYHWLALHLRAGHAADVVRAITQEQVWHPDLGGPPWSQHLRALLAGARAATGQPESTKPAAAAP